MDDVGMEAGSWMWRRVCPRNSRYCGGSWPGYGPPFCQGPGASAGGGALAAAADGKGVRGTGRIRRLSRAGAGGDGAPGGRAAVGGPDCRERSVGREQSGGTDARVGLGAVAGPPEDREPAFSRQGYGPAWAGGGEPNTMPIVARQRTPRSCTDDRPRCTNARRLCAQPHAILPPNRRPASRPELPMFKALVYFRIYCCKRRAT